MRAVGVILMVGCLAGLLYAGSPAAALAADELTGSQQELSEVQKQIDATLRNLRSQQAEAGDLSYNFV